MATLLTLLTWLLLTAVADRGKQYLIEAVEEDYPVMTPRRMRRLVAERRIAYSRVGRRLVFFENDINAYLEANRQEAMRGGVSRSA